MNDDDLRQLLKRADERLQLLISADAPSSTHSAALIETIRQRRRRQVRQRTAFGVLAVLFLAGGISAWGLNGALRSGPDQLAGATKSARTAVEHAGDAQEKPTDPPAARQKLNDDDIARLKAEIAALDAEANRTRQYIDLYRAAEARRERLATVEAAPAEALLPPDAIAQLEIDRAAAITVISADVQAKEFDRLDDAAESYRSVLEHFPDSRWASVAKQRLAQINHMN